MRVLHVNYADLTGRRFSGYDLLADMERFGVDSKQVVQTKLSENPRVIPLLDDADVRLSSALYEVEQRHGMNNLLPPWGKLLAALPWFAAAGVVHYHIIHMNMVSLVDLPYLFTLKPSVWTFHDAWPITGHCIQPGECTAWLNGCRHCPHLDRPLRMERDTADRMWRVKRHVLAKADVDVVVASNFMLEQVRRSPITAHLPRVHTIPFGVDVGKSLRDSEQATSRDVLGIPRDHFVLMFRASVDRHKGMFELLDALGLHRPLRPTTLLTVDHQGLPKGLANDYRLLELGWADGDLLARAFSACDVFAMPSHVEGFGMMALEAMAAGRPVISLEGTAVSDLTDAPSCGLAVPPGDRQALRAAIDHLSENAEDRRRRGTLGRRLALREYSHETYLQSLAQLYESVAARVR